MDGLQHQEVDNASHWARTTVLTLLKRFQDQGYVGRRKEGKSFYYKPTNPMHQVMDVILKRYFGSSAPIMLNTYLEHLHEQNRIVQVQLKSKR